MPHESCTFCQIINRELPASIIHEDEKVIVIVDLYPVNEGHLLIIPKVHNSEMRAVNSETLQHAMQLAQQMNVALRKSNIPCDGVNLFVADGEAAGQEIFHFHLHVFPRFIGDGFGFRYDRARHFKKSQRIRMDEIAAELKIKLKL